MAPKAPPSQRAALAVAWMRASLTVHTLKDLEKALPSAASIAAMQVKDQVQALVDEGLVRVEKIGSGNWYWSFGSEAKKSRATTLQRLHDEAGRWTTAIATLQTSIHAKEETEAQQGSAHERDELLQREGRLATQIQTLELDLTGFHDSDPAALEAKRTAIQHAREQAQSWTDNCWTLEAWLKQRGADAEALQHLLEECYGDQYIDGEGLAEL